MMLPSQPCKVMPFDLANALASFFSSSDIWARSHCISLIRCIMHPLLPCISSFVNQKCNILVTYLWCCSNNQDMENDTARNFWQRVDLLRGDRQLNDITQKAGLNYDTIRNKRSGRKPVLPNLQDGCALARELHTTVDYLLYGEEHIQISAEAIAVENDSSLKYIVRLCMDKPEFLQVVQAVLDSRLTEERKHV